MGLSAATLNGSRVTSGRVDIPGWGCWYADVAVDGELALSGAVELKIADLALRGTVLAGGPSKGRSFFRIVAGAGGWGRRLRSKSYANDASVKLATVLGDAAREAGETLADIASTERLGPAWARQAGPGCRLLELVAPGAWYVDEAGVTRLGARTGGTLSVPATRITPVDRARGCVELAAESIASILPGVVVDGLVGADVQHEISPKGGLRTTVWGTQGGASSRRLAAMRKIFEQLDPQRAFRGVTEYRVVAVENKRLELAPVRVSTGMPALKRVRVRPGVAGGDATAALGSYVLVAFVNADPSRPVVVSFEDAEGDGFQPTTLRLLAGGSAGGEHVMTTEATCLLIYNVLVALMATAGGGPLTAVILQPLIGAAINAALAAQAVPAPPTEALQDLASAAQLAGFATGTVPATSSEFFALAIEALATKTSNVSGKFPSIGCKSVEAG